jgi:ketosteroid isomerase-like protein
LGEARDVMNQLTDAIFRNDEEAVKQLYASDAVAETPDQGTVNGRDAVAAWALDFLKSFPDAKYEPGSEHESGDTAIDEGFFVGTNTGPLEMPDGQTLPPTGKRVRVRACDAATVANGEVISHRFYFDQMDFLGQLGLAPEE